MKITGVTLPEQPELFINGSMDGLLPPSLVFCLKNSLLPNLRQRLHVQPLAQLPILFLYYKYSRSIKTISELSYDFIFLAHKEFSFPLQLICSFLQLASKYLGIKDLGSPWVVSDLVRSLVSLALAGRMSP